MNRRHVEGALDLVRAGARLAATDRPALLRHLGLLAHDAPGVLRHGPLVQRLSSADYARWIAEHEPDEEELRAQTEAVAAFAVQPLVSIITPVFRPPPDVLDALVRSVLAQTYPRFELCLGDFSDDEATATALASWAAVDPRIVVRTFAENLGISENSRRCVELSSGDHLGLLDHDDLLAPSCLFENVRVLNERPFDFAYSDRDKLDEAGVRCQPFFKPGWSPEGLYAANFLTHFNLFSRALYDEVGGWRKETDGAQDWDLFARMTERTDRIAHIPKILYHWRMSSTSAARSMRAKPYAVEAQRLTVQRRLDRAGVAGRAAVRPDGGVAVDWPTPAVAPRLAVIVISTGGPPSDRWRRRLEARVPADARTVLLDPTATGPARSLAGAVADAIADGATTALVLDDTITIGPTTVTGLSGWLTLDGVAAAGPKVLHRNGIEDVGRVIGLTEQLGPLYRCHRSRVGTLHGSSEWMRNVYAPSLSCSMLDLQVIEELGVPAEPGPPLATLVALFAMLDRSGHRCVTDPRLVVRRRWTDPPATPSGACSPLVPAVDPYYNPNLSLDALIPQP